MRSRAVSLFPLLVGRAIRRSLTRISDLLTLVYLALRSVFIALRPGHRRFFVAMFKRQLLYTGVHAIYVNSAIAMLIGALIMTRLHGLAHGEAFVEVYANVFVTVVIRELGPLISGIILIARSCTAITVEVGYMRVNNELGVLRGMGIDPATLLLAPVYLAFPVSLTFMFLYFDSVIVLSAYAMIWLIDPSVDFSVFLGTILSKIGMLEVVITAMKGIFGGTVMAAISIYAGSGIGRRPADISRALSDATTLQLLAFFVINIALSVLAYS